MNLWKIRRYSNRYYLTHPWLILQDLVLAIRYTWQRSVRGYADIDRFNMDNWMIGVLAPMFEDYAKNHFGFPGEDAGFTDEEWTAYLVEVARHLRNASEDQTEQRNEYADEWSKVAGSIWDHVDTVVDKYGDKHIIKIPDMTDSQNAVRDKFFNREIEIAKWRSDEIKTAMKMIGDQFFSLWD